MNRPHRGTGPRRILLTAITLAASVTLVSCGQGDGSSPQASGCKKAGGKVTLTYWSWVPGMDKVVDEWNSTHPDIQVKLATVPSGAAGTYQKMSNAVTAGNAPDLGQIEYDTLPSFRLQDGLRDIADCGAARQHTRFPKWTWRQVSFGEESVYAIPQDTGPMALFYRKDLFAKYGIAVPTTWEEFEAAARKVRRADPRVALTNAAVGEGWLPAMAWQNGATWFRLDKDTWKVSVNDQPTRQVSDYWQRLNDGKLVSPAATFSEQWKKEIAEGKILTWPSAVWAASLIKTDAPQTSGKWGVAPLPQWTAGGEKKNGNWGGSATAVFKNSKYPWEAAQFAQWLSSDPEALRLQIRHGGLYPAAKGAQALPELRQGDPFYGGQKIYDVFAETSAHVDTSFTWGPTMTTTTSALKDAANASVNSRTSLTAGIDIVQRKTVEAMRQQGLDVQD
ncbi:sugar ABC transporter substrate-binding protein [Streptomyces sp. NPDC006458]|uniref:ABC transporter substrate-binding protein n=1 Tax=Streptomyces sp. NPDC006458 TaxID=3154302 RepID=UPI0033A17CA1